MDREELDTMITALTNCESAEEGECPEDCPMKDDEWKREGRAACRALVDDEIIVPAALIRRTVALLQAQEPRVMTLDELSETTIVYIENRVYGTVEPALSNGSYNDGTVGLITLEEEAMFYMLETDYNIEWRCWTSSPTDAQRAAEPWPKGKPKPGDCGIDL